MVADVVGSSRLIEADETAALSAMRERWVEIVEPLVKEHSGRIVNTWAMGCWLNSRVPWRRGMWHHDSGADG